MVGQRGRGVEQRRQGLRDAVRADVERDEGVAEAVLAAQRRVARPRLVGVDVDAVGDGVIRSAAMPRCRRIPPNASVTTTTCAAPR